MQNGEGRRSLSNENTRPRVSTHKMRGIDPSLIRRSFAEYQEKRSAASLRRKNVELRRKNVALLRKGLFHWRANLGFAFIILIWMSVLAAHIYLRFPWGDKDITSSKWCCAYLFFPALLAITLGIVMESIDPLSKKSGTFYTKIVEISRTDGLENARKAGKRLGDSACTQNKGLFIVLLILSIACMGVAGCLDRVTDPSKIKGLAIAECVLLAGIITTLIALAFTYYICENGGRVLYITDANINDTLNTTRARYLNSEHVTRGRGNSNELW